MNNNGKRSEWSQRSAAPTTGDSEPDKVIFNVYNICILCNYWTSVMKHSAWHKKKKKKKKKLVPGGKIVSGGRPRPAPPTVVTTLPTYTIANTHMDGNCIDRELYIHTLFIWSSHSFWVNKDPKRPFFASISKAWFERALHSQRVISGLQIMKGSESRFEIAFGTGTMPIISVALHFSYHFRRLVTSCGQFLPRSFQPMDIFLLFFLL